MHRRTVVVKRGVPLPLVLLLIAAAGVAAWLVLGRGEPPAAHGRQAPGGDAAAPQEGGSPAEIKARWEALLQPMIDAYRALPSPGESGFLAAAEPSIRAFGLHLEDLQRAIDRDNQGLAVEARQGLAKDFLELRAVAARHGLPAGR